LDIKDLAGKIDKLCGTVTILCSRMDKLEVHVNYLKGWKAIAIMLVSIAAGIVIKSLV